ncbi:MULTISPECIES: hypothetical protein [unclassified Bacillus (in: firmicutes)]|uniref:hypothetical protein n=1 Tax=unclassified Bacillus (in: firmicutes) TaxID=185979 RepID=UPI0008F27AFF|nr:MULTISPECIES: hypothetical protein [unclassified Bacillus (in: firmicutes)]SFJ36405.1 hypothetical protein SAMN04488574_11155 [Bacillus sp. 71mf]SFS51259.1 hypothetical protein SAMN04488145_101956 [Bacillus sp. 103mf]
MKRVLKKLGIVGIMSLQLCGCSSQEKVQNDTMKKEETVYKEEKNKKMTKPIPEKEEQTIKKLIDSYIQTINEKNFEGHMALFSTKSLGLEDTKAQKQAEFKNKNKKIDLLDFHVENFEGEYAVVETKEKVESGQKKVRYTVGKENDVWKIEDVRVIEEG